MPHPTAILGIGRLGRDVLERLKQQLAPSDTIRLVACAAETAGVQLEQALDELLRAGLAPGAPRLDIFVFVDVLDGGDQDLAQLCAQAARVVGGKFAVLFRADAPPEHRNAALHIIAVVPALAPNQDAIRALARLAALEQWTQRPTDYPIVARTWLLSRHTTAGTLTDEGIHNSCAAFVFAFISQRQEDRISVRMSHLRDDEGKFAFLSVASLNVPEARIRRHAAVRAGYDGLSSLATRVTRQASDPSLGDQAVATLEYGSWFRVFEDSPIVERCRGLAITTAGTADDLPGAITVRPLDEPATVRADYSALLRPAGTRREQTGIDQADRQETMRALDRAEAESTTAVARGVARLLEGEVGRSTGLRRLPEVELGLRRIQALLQDAEAHRGGGDNAQADVDEDPYREELEQAIAQLPSRRELLLAAGAFGFGIAAILVMVGLRIAAPSVGVAPGATMSSPTFSAAAAASGPLPWSQVAVWAGAIVGGLCAAVAWVYVAGAKGKKRVKELLNLRLGALQQLWSRGPRGLGGGQVEAQLRLRKRRVRRMAVTAVDQALVRLEVTRAMLLDLHARFLQELRDLGIKAPAANPAEDNLEPLLGSRDILHDILVQDTRLLSTWVARRRELTDPDAWADRLVEKTWPARGINEDVPCADEREVRKLCEWQVGPLTTTSILADPSIAEAAAQKVDLFARQVGESLAPPCQPRTVHGDPTPGIRNGELFAVAPKLAAQHFDPALKRATLTIPVLWTASPEARVLFVRTWEGYTVAEIQRGIGLVPGQEARS